MCGLFGFIAHGEKTLPDLSCLAEELAAASSVRGTDATGVAYVVDRKVQIEKKAVPGTMFKIRLPQGIKALIGHTRNTTTGNPNKNYNNHPFQGKCSGKMFALAHNGVLDADPVIRRRLKLARTKIETDSYIAVQLLEKEKTICMESVKKMAQTVEGMMAFNILTENNDTYLVKGDAPLCVYYFSDLSLYVYASTESILHDALSQYKPTAAVMSKRLFSNECAPIVKVDFPMETIIKIDRHGKLTACPFQQIDRWYLGGGYKSNWGDYLSIASGTTHSTYSAPAGSTLEKHVARAKSAFETYMTQRGKDHLIDFMGGNDAEEIERAKDLLSTMCLDELHDYVLELSDRWGLSLNQLYNSTGLHMIGFEMTTEKEGTPNGDSSESGTL